MILAFAAFLVLLRAVYLVGEIIFEQDWPRNTIRGLVTAMTLFGLCVCAFGQLASRVDIALQTTGPNVPINGNTILPQAIWLSNASVQVCVHPASIFSCTPAVTYNDSAEDATCPASTPLVQLPGVTCTASTGAAANVGFWFGGGTVDYIVTTSYGGPYGPFSVTQLTGSGSFVKTTPSGNVQQTVSGPLSKPYDQVTAPVPFQAASAAFLAYDQSGTGNVDLHSANGGGLDLWTPNILGTGWSNIVHIDNSGTIFPANDVQLTSGNCYYLGGVATEGICDDQFGGVNISTTSSATNGIAFTRGGTTQWQMAAAGTFLNASGQTVFPATVTTFQGASAGGPLLVSGTTGTGSTAVLATSPSIASPTLTGTPLAVTVANCASNFTQIATIGTINNCISAIASGVTSINGVGGTQVFTGAVSCTGTAPQTCNFTSASGVISVAAGSGIAVTGTGSGPFTGTVTISALAFHADVTISGIGAIAAQACSAILQVNLGSFGSFGSGAFVSLQAQSNYTSTTGWSPVLTPITPTIVPDPTLANYVDVRGCNTNASGGASITPATFGARILVVP